MYAAAHIAAAALASSCGAALDSMDIEVALPPFPEAWRGAGSWELSWTSAAGSGGPWTLPPDSTALIALPRRSEAVILCRASIGGALTLPYGACWPQELTDDGTLYLSAAGGWAASAAARLYLAGMGECGLDIPRLAREVAERLDDPWDLDPASILPAVVDGRLRADHLKAPAYSPLELSGVPGPLSPDSPWGAPIEPDGEGRASVSLPIGSLRRWMGGGFELLAWAPEAGEAAYVVRGSDPAAGTLIVNALPAPSRLSTEASPP